jgi:PD-(D/E)XK nuclease superfamily
MRAKHQLSADFLADLDVVCPKVDDGTLPLTFVRDLETAYAHALASSPREPSAADLASLAGDLEVWRGHHQGLLRRYLAQLPADDPLLCPVSLFGTMDYGRLETAHTRALAWLLGDQEHGFGSRLLEALLRLLLEGREIRLTHVGTVESEHPVPCGPTSGGPGRVDVLAEGRWEESGEEVTWRLVIEAKIDAGEGDEQLSRYDDWIEGCSPETEVLRVFLTPDGREPETGSAEWAPLSFLSLASLFRRVSSGLQDRPGYHFLRYYLAGVLQDVCGLRVRVSPDCENPYAAVDYVSSVLGTPEPEGGDGQRR